MRALASMLCGATLAVVPLLGGQAAARRPTGRCHARAHRRCDGRHRRTAPAPVRRRPPSTLAVHAHEYRLTLSRGAVVAGAVIVELDNEGEDPHNMHAQALDGSGPELAFPTLRSGARTTQTLQLPAGQWRLWCTLPGHDQRGMHAILRVTG